MKQKRNRIKEEREMENRRVSLLLDPHTPSPSANFQDETSHLISELKEQMSQHNTIFKDISSVLKSLLKVSPKARSRHGCFSLSQQIIPHRGLQNYSNAHREFLEVCHTVVKHTLHMDRNSSMKYETLISKMKRILTIKTR